MPFRITEFQPTPNPDALKCILDRPPTPSPDAPALRSYRDPAGAASDSLGAAIMAIDGVRAVLIGDGWLTVTRADGADWKKLKARLETALAALPHESHAPGRPA